MNPFSLTERNMALLCVPYRAMNFFLFLWMIQCNIHVPYLRFVYKTIFSPLFHMIHC